MKLTLHAALAAAVALLAAPAAAQEDAWGGDEPAVYSVPQPVTVAPQSAPKTKKQKKADKKAWKNGGEALALQSAQMTGPNHGTAGTSEPAYQPVVDPKAAKKAAKQAKKAQKKEAKAEKQADKEEKKQAKVAKKAEKQAAKDEKKEEKVAKKAAKQEEKAAKKAEKAVAKADKKQEKSLKKEEKALNKTAKKSSKSLKKESKESWKRLRRSDDDAELAELSASLVERLEACGGDAACEGRVNRELYLLDVKRRCINASGSKCDNAVRFVRKCDEKLEKRTKDTQRLENSLYNCGPESYAIKNSKCSKDKRELDGLVTWLQNKERECGAIIGAYGATPLCALQPTGRGGLVYECVDSAPSGQETASVD
ncbi:MAG: hypothetical protein SF051_12345 [Elusimicrobiota bacterium]|nr:hypothetical protein [Elusimicrobiota bacterium]